MPKAVPDTSGYHVNFIHRGRRYRVHFSNGEHPDPKLAAEKFIQSVLAGEQPPAAASIETLVDKYLTWSTRVRNKSPKTVRSDRQRLSVFLTWVKTERIRSARAISVNTIRAFQEYYFANAPFSQHRRKGNPVATWEKYRQVLSAFFNWCSERDAMDKNPLSKKREFVLPAHRKRPEIFSPEEMEQLFAYFDSMESPAISAFFRFLAYTGCRLSEATHLRWTEIDLRLGEVSFIQTKNYEPRTVPIAAPLQPFLAALSSKNTYVFDSGQDTPIYHDSWWWKLLRQATTALQMKPRPIHAFRHTFGSSLAEQDVNLATIKELMGHRRIETTLIYLQFTKKKKREAVGQLPF